MLVRKRSKKGKTRNTSRCVS